MKKKTSKKKRKENNNLIFPYKDPMNLILHFIGFIIVIYGAWFNNVLWMLLGFIPMLIGYWWEKANLK